MANLPMGMTYFKRYRMELDLTRPLFVRQPLTPGYRLVPWHQDLLSVHAETKYQSFRSEVDANVFPCLGELDGCYRLMNEISRKHGFLESATWLIAFQAPRATTPDFCGTIQGIEDRSGMGAIQNLGVTPEHRGQGLGSILMHQALQGFIEVGLRRVFLEVTAQNDGAIQLYQRMGFQTVKTLYKAAELAYS